MRKALWIGGPLLALTVLVGWRFQVNKQTATAAAQQQGQRRGAAPAVELAVAGPGTLREVVESVGTAESPERVELSSKVSGRIESLSVREGDNVKAGEIIVMIDPSEQQSLVLQAQANLAEAESKLAQALMGSTPNSVGIESLIQQRQAELTSAKANLLQVQRSREASIATAKDNQAEAESKRDSAQVELTNAGTQLAREQTTLKNLESRLARIEALNKEGFASTQALEDIRASVDSQRSAVEVARGDVSSAKSDLDGAKAQVRAQINQVTIAERKATADLAAATADVTRAQAVLNSATSNRAQKGAYQKSVAALQATVNAARAQLEQAKTRLKDLNLVSPMDGTVTQRNADPGSLASPGQKLLVVQSLEQLDVIASLPLDQKAVRVGQTALIRFDALPDADVKGVISNVNPAADVQNRQYGIRIRIENSDRKVRPGMFGHVAIELSSIEAEVVVPKEAIKESDKGTTVTVIGPDFKAEVREVKVGLRHGDLVQILSGVKAGEKVVVMSFQPIKDGQQVADPAKKGESKGNSKS